MKPSFISIYTQDYVYFYLPFKNLNQTKDLLGTMGNNTQYDRLDTIKVDNDTLKDISTSIANPDGEKLVVIKVDNNFFIYSLVHRLLSVDFNELLVINGQISGL
jgi:hypothetical protein